MICPLPPTLSDLRSNHIINAGLSTSTVLADMDFETYSPAGYIWDEDLRNFKSLPGTKEKGLSAVGVAAYTQHPEAEVLSLAYDLKDGFGKRLWIPGQPSPLDLFDHVEGGKLIEAWNVSFEHWVWVNICIKKYDFPPINHDQLRCAMAKARAHALPGALGKSGEVLNIVNRKDKDGVRLLNKFSLPRKPTLKDIRKRILPSEDFEDAAKLYDYNIKDIEAESELSSLIPDLSPTELEFWLCDQKINFRGVKIDLKSINSSIKVVEKAYKKYNEELFNMTNGEVKAASEIQKLKSWMKSQGVITEGLTADIVTELLKKELPNNVRRALQIRELVGSAAVKKLYAMKNQATKDERLHDLFIYHSARTGRAAGTGPQPQNFPNSGLEVNLCLSCGKHCVSSTFCKWCNAPTFGLSKKVEWNDKATEDAIETLLCENLEWVEHYWGDAFAAISGCLRSFFIASKGHDLLCSDYSAIEAVVLAALAGEEWRLEVFKTHGKIYEMSASKISGIPFIDFIEYKKVNGQHHPLRKKVGKVAELASGYGGALGAWKRFGADEFFNDEDIKKSVKAWRTASPKIVEMWGGQTKNWKPHIYGLEGAAINAVNHPGEWFSYRSLSYIKQGDVLYCKLPSGRLITYHRPQLRESRFQGCKELSFEGWNTNPENGPRGWIRMNTYGGKLTENVVQAVARDILSNAIVNLEKSGYPVVLHVHDEIVCEVPENFGSIEEFEKIMSTMPDWAKSWPIKAEGGWRRKRYGK